MADSGATISVSPDHGGPSTTFQLRYTEPLQAICGDQPRYFRWNGLQLAPTTAHLDATGTLCVATATAKPLTFGGPIAPGQYEISITNSPGTTATFTVDAAADPTPTHTPKAPTTKPAPHTSAPARPAAPSTSLAGQPNQPVDTPSTATDTPPPSGNASVAAPRPVGARMPHRDTGYPWYIAGAVVLLVIGVLALLRLRTRRNPVPGSQSDSTSRD